MHFCFEKPCQLETSSYVLFFLSLLFFVLVSSSQAASL